MKRRNALVLWLFGLSSLCWANALPDLGPKHNFEAANVVVIGKAIALGATPLSERPWVKAMTIDVEVVMKGQVTTKTILVPYGRYGAEFLCKDGVVGQRYLLLLSGSGDSSFYYTQNGCYGVFEMNDTRVTH